MRRLYPGAYEILVEEVKRTATKDAVGQVSQQLVIQRLDRLRSQSGNPLTEEELRVIVTDQFPEFNDKVLKRAARANRPPGVFSRLLTGSVVVGALGGFVWLANLPYPMVRWPIARTVPILLLPSYINMDYNYRQAISLVEQSDQLVNNATAGADIDLGAQKVKQAQKHLDQLPVWFLGYYPKLYCRWFSCQWKFTLDEFETARKDIGRMEAKVFQEKNALTQMADAEKALSTAKQKYQQTQAGIEQQQAIAGWQTALDWLGQIPEQTLAGRMAQQKLAAAERDFTKEVGSVAERQQSNTVITAAKQFAIQAAQASQNPPHSADKWKQVISLWEEAINRLEKVPQENPGYLEAQKKLAEYKYNLGSIQTRMQQEIESVQILAEAEKQITEWRKSARSKDPDIDALAIELQDIMYTLQQIPPGTTAYPKSQELLRAAQHTYGKL